MGGNVMDRVLPCLSTGSTQPTTMESTDRGFMDKIKGALQGKTDQAAKAIDKAADVVDDKTGGKHADKIDRATGKARDALDSLDGKNDDIPPGTTR